MKIIRWGILATGGIAHTFADTAAHLGGEIVMAAAASRSIEKARVFAGQYGIPKAYGSYEEMAEDPDIDIVYVATPHNQHAENMELCLAHGKHVLCEKPFTVNAGEARRIYDLAREKGLLVLEAFWTKFIPIYRRVERLLADGAIGHIHLVKAQCGYVADRSVWRMHPALAGGALLDIGVYNLGFASMVLGYHPKQIKTMVHMSDTGVDECSSVILQYENRALAECTTAFGTHIPTIGTIYGSEGMIHIPDFKNPQRVEIIMNDGSTSAIEQKFDCNGYEYQMREAVACLEKGRTQSEIMTPGQSIAVMEIMDKIRDIWGMRYPFE